MQAAAKRDVSDGELVHHDAHRVDIDAVVDFFAIFDLFGCGVFEGSEDGACGGFFIDIIEEFGDAEVCEFWRVGVRPVGGEHDVAGFEIAVDDAFAVGVCKGIKEREEEGAEFFRREQVFTTDQVLFEIGSFDPFLHHAEEFAVVKEFDNTDDGIVLHTELDLGFADKTAPHDAICGEVWEEEFEGHRAFEGAVMDFVDPRHPALGDKLLDMIPFGDLLADDAMGVFGEILRGDCHRFFRYMPIIRDNEVFPSRLVEAVFLLDGKAAKAKQIVCSRKQKNPQFLAKQTSENECCFPRMDGRIRR